MNSPKVSKRVVVYYYEFKDGKKFYRFVPSRYNRRAKKFGMIEPARKITTTKTDSNELGTLLKETFKQCEFK